MAGSWAFSHTSSLSGPPQSSQADLGGHKKVFFNCKSCQEILIPLILNYGIRIKKKSMHLTLQTLQYPFSPRLKSSKIE